MTGALIIATGKTDHQSAFAPERQIGRISALERMVLLLQMTGIRRIGGSSGHTAENCGRFYGTSALVDPDFSVSGI